MYKTIVRRFARETFRRLGEGDYESALGAMAEDVRHTYLGRHPCGGTRRSVHDVKRWFERVHRLFPELHHDVKEVLVRGGPWNTVVAVQWTGHVRSPEAEQSLEFDGVHIVRFKWGRVIEMTAYPDTTKIETYFAQLAAKGVSEANAAPIES